MTLTPDDLYLRLGLLVSHMPDLDGITQVMPETNEWLGRAMALVELIADPADKIAMKIAMHMLTGSSRTIYVQTIRAVVMSALARAELQASAEVQGRFIPVDSPHQAFVAVGNVLRLATIEVLIVDAYADATALSDFAIQVSEKVSIRLLTDVSKRKLDLEPAIVRWRQEHGQQRPLTAALAKPRALHDRIIIIDGQIVWTIGQSLNGLGKKSPTAIFKIPNEMAQEKIAAYEDIWNSANQI